MPVDPEAPRHNIIIFGETGAGKSSVINMLLGKVAAEVSSEAAGCTLSSTPHDVNIGGHKFTLWDTAGLNEGGEGSVSDMKALSALYHLLRGLEDGVSLAVFCMRAPRLTDAAVKNWKFFKHILCQGKVPTVIVVTGLEEWNDEDSKRTWWEENQEQFRKSEINPTEEIHRTFDLPVAGVKTDRGVACITASKGKVNKRGEYVYQDEFDLSRLKVMKLFVEAHMRVPWKVEQVQWFKQVVYTVRDGGLCPSERQESKWVAGKGVHELMVRWGIPNEDQATRIVKVIEEGVAPRKS